MGNKSKEVAEEVDVPESAPSGGWMWNWKSEPC